MGDLGTNFLSSSDMNRLTLTELGMWVDTNGPKNGMTVDFTVGVDNLKTNVGDSGIVTSQCTPSFLVEISDSITKRELAKYTVRVLADFSHPPSEGEHPSEAMFEDLFVESMMSAFSFARIKVHELSSISPMGTLTLPNANRDGMREIVAHELELMKK